MDFKKNDGVSHLYFGIGVVATVKRNYYEIRFIETKEKRCILKNHPSLQPSGHLWKPEELEAAKKYIEDQNRRGATWVNWG